MMAHHIYFHEQTGKHAFFSVREKAWHGLGTIVEEYPTSAEALKFAGLDYTVEKRRLFTSAPQLPTDPADPLTVPIEVPRFYATLRTDTGDVLGVVGNDYQVVQNAEAFTFFDALVGGSGIRYETAGALGKGERIFITAKLPDYIKVGREDLIEQYLFLTTAHDGGGSITAAFTPVRIVCANTLNAALKNSANTVKIRHTASAARRLQTAHRLMGISNALSRQLDQLWNAWAKVPITDNAVKKLITLALSPRKESIASLHPEERAQLSAYTKHTIEDAFAYALSHPTQLTETTRGSLFGAYNALTGYFQNVRCYKSGEAKLRSLLLGGTAQQKTQKAFDLCREFARKGTVSLS